MRIAWFREVDQTSPLAFPESAAAVAELGQTHEIVTFGSNTAHTFVWRHFHAPFDLCIYDLTAPENRSYAYGYARHYPGLALTRGEMPVGVDGVPTEATQDTKRKTRNSDSSAVRFGVVPGARSASARRAAQRAADLGARLELVDLDAASQDIDADVVVALAWPPANESLIPALTAMAAGKPVIVLEVAATAGWPALDPQTWRLRDPLPTGSPIAVSVDVRDEEHSLMLAMRRLAADADLRDALGAAAHAWWRSHATPAHAMAAWKRLVEESARQRPDPTIPVSDGTDRALTVLADFDTRVDFLSRR